MGGNFAPAEVSGSPSIAPQRRRMELILHWRPGRNITREEVIAFLVELLRHLRGNVGLLWDRLNAQRSALCSVCF